MSAPQSGLTSTRWLDRQARSARSGASGDARSAKRCPPSLTGGEKTVQQGAKVDWLTATFMPAEGELIDRNVMEWLVPLLGEVGGESTNGFHQYENGLRFWTVSEGCPVNLGRLDWGGEARKGKARLELTGHGCTMVKNWAALQEQLALCDEIALTRVDLAVDLLDGEYSVEDALNWWREGEFRAGAQGLRPRHSMVGDWGSDQPVHGRTLEIGRRENGKMCRVYEKGRQLGNPESDWTRFEVELRNNDRDLPLDILTDCDKYFTGAYLCLQQLLDVAGERIKTHQKEGEITLEVACEHARNQAGKVINVLRLTGLSFEEVHEQISRPGIPKRLVRASLGGFINGSPPDPVH